jgi:hypothetical protein
MTEGNDGMVFVRRTFHKGPPTPPSPVCQSILPAASHPEIKPDIINSLNQSTQQPLSRLVVPNQSSCPTTTTTTPAPVVAMA